MSFDMPNYIRQNCSRCGDSLGFNESDPCDRCSVELTNQQPQPPQPEAPDWPPARIWLWNDGRDYHISRTDESDIEYIRADLAAERPADEDERVKAAREDERRLCIEDIKGATSLGNAIERMYVRCSRSESVGE